MWLPPLYEQSTPLSSLGFLAAGLAQEVNNPNTFIRTNLQTFERFWKVIDGILSEQKTLPENIAKKVSFIHEEMPHLITGMEEGTDRISRLVGDITGFGHRRELKFGSVDIKEPIESALRLVDARMRQEDIQKTQDLAEGPFLVQGNSQLLSQVFVNLFNNAIDALVHLLQPRGQNLQD